MLVRVTIALLLAPVAGAEEGPEAPKGPGAPAAAPFASSSTPPAEARTAPPPAVPVPVPSSTPPLSRAIAFQLDAKLAVDFASFGSTTSTVPRIGAPQLLAGIRIGRFAVELGFAFARLSLQTTNTSFAFAPTATYDVFVSDDQRFSLYALLAVPLGATLTPNGAAFDDALQLAFGLRIALHRYFALAVEAGALAEFLGVDQKQLVTVASTYGALVGTFVYPR